jgi:hypothetical protein
MTETILVTVASVFVVQGIWKSVGSRVAARRWTRLVPVPGPERRFEVWSREGGQLGTICPCGWAMTPMRDSSAPSTSGRRP